MPSKRSPARPKKHGGRREGAGRPPLPPGTELKVVAVRLSSANVAKVERWQEANGLDTFSEAVREMIDAADRVDRGA